MHISTSNTQTLTLAPNGGTVYPIFGHGLNGNDGVDGTDGNDGAPGEQGLPGVNAVANDTATAGYIASSSSETAAAVAVKFASNSAANKNPLERIRTDQPFIAALYGMSISSFARAPVQHLDTMLRNQFGAPSYMFYRAGIYGGTFEALNNWEKQPYGGVGTIRARGKSTSTTLTFNFYGDTYDFVYSRESNSEACPIKIDGTTVGTTLGAGSQAYNQHIKGTVTLGQHTVTITPPTGAGYLYWEYVLCYDSTTPGAMVLDFTVGGTALKAMRTLQGAATGQIAGIAISGDNGVAGCYDRSDFSLIINGQDVNDAGNNDIPGVTSILAAMAGHTFDNRTPLLHVSSMAGHYARTADARKPDYDAIKAIYQSQASTYSHISHFDWDSLTRMPQALIDDGTYQATYYTEPNPAGFIHPEADEAYMIGTLGLARQLGLEVPTQTNAGLQWVETLRRFGRPEPRVDVVTPTRVIHSDEVLEITAVSGREWVFKRPHNLAVDDEFIVDHDTADSGDLDLYSMIRNYYGASNSWFVKTVIDSRAITVTKTLGGTVVASDGLGSGRERVYRVLPASIKVDPKPAGYAYATYVPGIQGQGKGAVTPYYADLRVPNGARSYQATIDASGTSDEYGKYVVPVTTTIGAQTPTGSLQLKYNEPTTLTIRLRPGTQFSMNPHTNSVQLDRFGGRLSGIGQDAMIINSVTAADDGPPIVVVMHLLGTVGGYPQTVYVQSTGTRIYGLWWVQGLLPILNS